MKNGADSKEVIEAILKMAEEVNNPEKRVEAEEVQDRARKVYRDLGKL